MSETTVTVAQATQYLTFRLAEEIYALDICKVREVLEFKRATRVPQMPRFMRGVINLRGSVVSVVDFRLKFGMTETETTVNTCVIITEVELNGEQIVIGAMADSVQEVIELTPDSIEPPPRIGTKLRTDFIKGMGKRNGKFVIIMDLDRVFSAAELNMIHHGEEAEQAHETSSTGLVELALDVANGEGKNQEAPAV